MENQEKYAETKIGETICNQGHSSYRLYFTVLALSMSSHWHLYRLTLVISSVHRLYEGMTIDKRAISIEFMEIPPICKLLLKATKASIPPTKFSELARG